MRDERVVPSVYESAPIAAAGSEIRQRFILIGLRRDESPTQISSPLNCAIGATNAPAGTGGSGRAAEVEPAEVVDAVVEPVKPTYLESRPVLVCRLTGSAVSVELPAPIIRPSVPFRIRFLWRWI